MECYPLMQSIFIVNIGGHQQLDSSGVTCSKLRQHKMKNALLTIWRTTFPHLSFLLTAVLAFDLCLSYALTFSVAVCLSYARTFSVEVLGPKTLHVTEVGGMIPDPCFGGNTADLSLPKLSPPANANSPDASASKWCVSMTCKC